MDSPAEKSTDTGLLSALFRIHVDGADAGGATLIGDRLLLTASHCISEEARFIEITCCANAEDEPRSVDVNSLQRIQELDVALFTTNALPTIPIKWRPADIAERIVVRNPPGLDASYLTGVVAVPDRTYRTEGGHIVPIMQLLIHEVLQDYSGYSGCAVLSASGELLAIVLEQQPTRGGVTGGGLRLEAANVLYALPMNEIARHVNAIPPMTQASTSKFLPWSYCRMDGKLEALDGGQNYRYSFEMEFSTFDHVLIFSATDCDEFADALCAWGPELAEVAISGEGRAESVEFQLLERVDGEWIEIPLTTFALSLDGDFGSYAENALSVVRAESHEPSPHRFRLSCCMELDSEERVLYWTAPRALYLDSVSYDLSTLIGSIIESADEITPYPHFGGPVTVVKTQQGQLHISVRRDLSAGQGVTVRW